MTPLDPLSGYAVHFTRGASPEVAAKARQRRDARPRGIGISHLELMQFLTETDESGFYSSLSILGSGVVRATSYPMGVASAVTQLEGRHRAACFSEAPLDDLAQLVETRSLYGVGFTQEFLGRCGGAPVTYLRSDSDEGRRIEREVANRVAAGVRLDDPLWDKTPFIETFSDRDDTRWEREWRVPGGLRFSSDDAAFLFLPAELHERARDFFSQNNGPPYLGVYLDPRWSRDELEAAIETS